MPLTETTLTTYRDVILSHRQPSPIQGAERPNPRFSSLFQYARLDGVPATIRKALTRLQGRGQFAPYSMVRFEASGKVDSTGKIHRGRWEGIAIGQLVRLDQRIELVTWKQDLSDATLREVESPCQRPPQKRGIALIGCGAFSHNVIVPALARAGATITGVADSSLLRAKHLADRIGTAVVYPAPADLLQSANQFDGMVIACAHGAHAGYATRALASGVPTLLEKPAAVDARGLRQIVSVYRETDKGLRVGHNRRFARDYNVLHRLASHGTPVDIQADVEAFSLPAHHWYYAPGEGGRVLGNLTHWLDLAIGICQDADPMEMRTTALRGDGVKVELRFPNFSTASLRLHDVGYRVIGGREKITVRTPHVSAYVDDWSVLRVEGSHWIRSRSRPRDRGHAQEYAHWYKSLFRKPSRSDILEPVRSHICAYTALSQLASNDASWQPLPRADRWLRPWRPSVSEDDTGP